MRVGGWVGGTSSARKQRVTQPANQARKRHQDDHIGTGPIKQDDWTHQGDLGEREPMWRQTDAEWERPGIEGARMSRQRSDGPTLCGCEMWLRRGREKDL